MSFVRNGNKKKHKKDKNGMTRAEAQVQVEELVEPKSESIELNSMSPVPTDPNWPFVTYDIHDREAAAKYIRKQDAKEILPENKEEDLEAAFKRPSKNDNGWLRLTGDESPRQPEEKKSDEHDEHLSCLAQLREFVTTLREFFRPLSGKEWAVEFLTFLADAIEFVFAWFLFKKVGELVDTTADEFGMRDVPEFYLTCYMWAFKYFLNGVGALSNLFCDLLSINHCEDWQDLFNERTSNLTPAQQKAAKLLSGLIFFGCALVSFFSLAAADIISTGEPISGIALTLLSMMYYIVFTVGKLRDHCEALVSQVSCSNPSTLGCGDIVESLEILLRILSNTTYRTIMAAFTAQDASINVFGLKPDDPKVTYWMTAAAATTLIVTPFSRSLAVKKDFFNSKFNEISDETYDKVKIRPCNLLFDLGVSLSRGGALGFMLGKGFLSAYVPASPIPTWAIGSAVGSVTTGLQLAALYKKRKKHDALDLHQAEGGGRALLTLEQPQDAEDISDNPEKLFDLLRKHNQTKRIETVATWANYGATSERLFAFLGFVSGLTDFLKMKITFADKAAFASAAGGTTLAGDRPVFKAEVEANVAYWKTKWQIGAPKTWMEKSNRLTRSAAAFFYPRKVYDAGRIIKALNDQGVPLLTASQRRN